jgi:inorganic pyrophosphatase
MSRRIPSDIQGMKSAIRKLGPFNTKKKCLNVIIETPKGSSMKYAYDEQSGFFEMKKALPEGMVFPFNFGFVPGTKAEDGDPLDILILNQGPLFPGCLVRAKLVGAIEAQQTEKGKKTRNDRLIGLAIGKETPTFMEEMEVTKKTWKEIEYFFVSYNKLAGKKFEVVGKKGPKHAIGLVKKARKTFQKEKE